MDDLKLIKDKYGEKMAHLCRSLFPTILETKGLLFGILSSNFQYSKTLYNDIVSNGLVDKFKDYILKSLKSKEIESIDIDKSPFELMKEAGYTLYECNSETEILQFKKYYAPGEELCTFEGGRLTTCYVFFAVKNNADKLNRSDFTTPKREDEYGTSVIGIQFTRSGNNYVSIKNRYNHSVINPDATFSNDLDNIIPGLTLAFKKSYGFKISNLGTNFEIPKYVQDGLGKRYKYNYEINNTYYCNDNVIISGYQVQNKYLDKNRYLVFDYFALDLKEKKIIITDYSLIGKEGLINLSIDNTFDKLSILKDKEKGTKNITLENEEGKVIVTLDKNNRMISYYDDISKIIDSNFLAYSKYIKNIDLPNAELIKSNFLPNCEELEYFNAPNLKKIGNNFIINSHNVLFNTPLLNIEGTINESIADENRRSR